MRRRRKRFLSFSLNYPRGYIHPGITDQAQQNQLLPAEWNPWSPVLRNLADPDFGGDPNINPETNANNDPNTPIGTYAQPMLTGLTFDSNGSITIGIRDRSSDQFGVYTPVDINAPIQDRSEYRVGISGGDTLRAFGSPATGWVLESNGSNPSGTPTSNNGVGNGQGPGGGEFYAGDYLKPGIKPGVQDHQEVSPRRGSAGCRLPGCHRHHVRSIASRGAGSTPAVSAGWPPTARWLAAR